MRFIWEYFIFFLVFGGIGAVIGFLISLFGKKLNVIMAIVAFYVMSTFAGIAEALIFHDNSFKDLLSFAVIGQIFIYNLHLNTLFGLPMFLISRKIFLKLT